MLAAIKLFLKKLIVPIMYLGGFVISVLTAFKDVRYGYFLLVYMIPQPNFWYKFHGYPLGKDFMDIVYLSILIGMVVQKKSFIKTKNSNLLIVFILLSYFSLWNSSLRFNLPLPITLDNHLLFDWKNYAQAICLYFITLNIIKDEKNLKIVTNIMVFSVFFMAVRGYRNFSGGAAFTYEKRFGGPFEAVGLGANHFGAFIAHSMSQILGLALLDKEIKEKIFFMITFLLCLHPLFFSYSRGAYLGAAIGFIFLGIVKNRLLLVAVIVAFMSWQIILPVSVVDRIEMTRTENGEIESSAQGRLELWKQAADIFESNPVFGAGYGGYSLSIPSSERWISGNVELTDTHNYFIKIACEQGIIGLCILVAIFFKAFYSGWNLYNMGLSNFQKGLGLGFCALTISCFLTNMFGDRFSYFVLGGYFWIFWGLVDRAIILSQN